MCELVQPGVSLNNARIYEIHEMAELSCRTTHISKSKVRVVR